MPVETLFISGPSHSGKSTAARLFAEQVLERPAHFLRLHAAHDGHTNSVNVLTTNCDSSRDDENCNGFASTHSIAYTSDRIFETLPEGLRAVRRLERNSFAIIEADGDPCLRHAFPYDYRVFVMSPPKSIYDVFRTPESAAEALQQVMQDTAAFASEIFGLFDAAGLDDTVGVMHMAPPFSERHRDAVEKLDVNESQIRQFINSPVGAEIASRIQLQPEYHGLVESDVVVINTGLHKNQATLQVCVDRLEKLLGRLRHDARRHSVLYWGNIESEHDPKRARLLRRMRQLIGYDPPTVL